MNDINLKRNQVVIEAYRNTSYKLAKEKFIKEHGKPDEQEKPKNPSNN